MTGPAQPFAEKETLTSAGVSCLPALLIRRVERADESRERLQLTLGQREGRHAPRRAVADQVPDLVFRTAPQNAIVDESRTAIRAGSAGSVAGGAELGELAPGG